MELLTKERFMRYNIATGVKKQQIKFKKLIIGVVASAGMVTGMAVPALAAGGSSGSNASASGASHGAFADQNGSFGWLGELGGTPGYHAGAVGQEPGATGYNNSQGCWNPE